MLQVKATSRHIINQDYYQPPGQTIVRQMEWLKKKIIETSCMINECIKKALFTKLIVFSLLLAIVKRYRIYALSKKSDLCA